MSSQTKNYNYIGQHELYVSSVFLLWMYYRILDPKMAAATTLTDIGYISVSVVGYDVIDERGIRGIRLFE